LGTVSQEATAGTQGETEPDPRVRFRGDELDLYAEFHPELLRMLRANVRCAPEDIDDAASFAWVQFLRYQPSRDNAWKGWLYRTAQREAWRLNAEHCRASLRPIGSPSTRARRTISYLTCTKSRASKNSELEKRSSLTASGRGFKLRASRNARTFGSSPARAITPPLPHLMSR
jgi:hypothetical protein